MLLQTPTVNKSVESQAVVNISTCINIKLGNEEQFSVAMIY